MRSRHLFIVAFLLALPVIACAQLMVTATDPASGARNVDPSTTEIRVRFNAPVRTDSYSVVNTNQGTPLDIQGHPTFEQGGLICVIHVRMDPGVSYSVGINSERFRNFRSAAHPNISVTPFVLNFTTKSSQGSPGAAVTVVSTFPQNGATDVDPSVTKIRVRFSAPVETGGYSFVDTDRGKPLNSTGKPTFEDGGMLCILPVKLEPGTTYAVSINSDRFRNFRSAAQPDVSVTPYFLSFTTKGKVEMTPAKWQEDVDYLATELPKRHNNLFFKMTEKDWKNNTQSLRGQIPTMSEPEILVGLKKLFAPIGDQHSDIGVFQSDRLKSLPLFFYWFKDGLFVVGASDTYKNMLGCRLVKVGDVDIDKACDAVSTLFAYDNESSRKKLVPFFMAGPDFLKSVKLIPTVDMVPLTVADASGKTIAVKIQSMKNGTNVNMNFVVDKNAKVVPLYKKNPSQPYWAEYVDNGKLVYFQYNQCIDSPEYPFDKMRGDVEKLMGEHPDARLVIDLRNNGGGNSSILDPFIDSLRESEHLNKKGKVFVITGRRTFSSGVLNAARLRYETNAILVGEPAGGAPNHFGEVKTFQLPNSGLTVSYSTKHFTYSKEDVSSIPVDLLVQPTFAEYQRGDDPVLSAIINYKGG